MYRCVPKSVFRILTGLSGLVFMASTALGAEYTVVLNKTQIVHLPTQASAIVVGNPDIADISVHSPDTIFIVGRGYGVTNMIVLDKLGQTVMETNIRVTEGMSQSGVHIYKVGEGRETYDCSPYCLQSPILGDSAEFMSGFGATGEDITNTVVTPPQSGFNSQSGQDPRTFPAPQNPYEQRN